ncbi:MAG: TIGR03663 family protein [Chloroflexi bacterium]|nr:TIGR03663 family protein [Chloroflexota bacterium]
MSDNASGTSTSLLDRPLLRSGRLSWEAVALTLLIVFVVATRLWDLDARGYEHDESIHSWEAWKLATGQGYVHDPPYHGPFLYHYIAGLFVLLGDSDTTARLGPALFGIALALLPWTLRRWLGRKGALASMVLMAVSPVVMCRSRFVWHDVPGSVVNLLLLLAVARYLQERRNRDLYLTAGLISWGLCIKGTANITYAILGLFLALLFIWQWLRDRSQPWRALPAFDLCMLLGTLVLPTAAAFPIALLGHDPIAYDRNAILFSGGVFLAMLAVATLLGLWWDRRRWLISAAIFWAIYVPLYTTFFTNLEGFGTGVVGMLGYWIAQHGVRRGEQPWFYYLMLLGLYEFLPVIAASGSVALYVWKGDRRARAERAETGRVRVPLVPLLIWWCVGVLAAYTWAGEKMPWLTMHIVLPLHLLAGWGLGRLLETDWRRAWGRGGLWLLVLAPLLVYTLTMALLKRPVWGAPVEPTRLLAWLSALLLLGTLVAAATLLYRRLGARQAGRLACLGFAVVLLALTLRFAWMATYTNADYATEFLVYAAGTPDTPIVTHELERLSRRLYGDLSLSLMYDDESWWPFSWYLRDFTNTYTYRGEPSRSLDADALIINLKSEQAARPYIRGDYYERKARMLWWPNEDWYRPMTLRLLWEALRDPEERRALWDVVYYRKHGQPTTEWYNGNSIRLYLREDLDERLWNLDRAGALP